MNDSSNFQEDAKWAAQMMGLPPTAFDAIAGDDSRGYALGCTDTADFEACPGSGKTTLLVAKLAVLSRTWRSRNQGMCVLSHTNAARNEIGSRLSSSAVDLLKYPHFVGTIHSFVNEFLALPWLRSKGNPVKAIDTEIALERRWHALSFATRSYLERKFLSKYSLAYDRPDYGGGDKRGLGEHTDTYQRMVAVSRGSSESGYFCYDEMFVWAGELLDKCPWTVSALRRRFPVVFIDEAQDNSELQSSLLSRIFCQGPNPSIRQRFGDSNQAIYQYARQSGARTDAFPGSVKYDLPRSYRFGQTIADLARPLGVSPQNLIGAGPSRASVQSGAKSPTIFLFDDASVEAVLPRYGELLISSFGAEELAAGRFTAVSAVHDAHDDTPIPRSLRHYAPGYDASSARTEAAPCSFAQYLNRGQRSARERRETAPLVAATAEAVIHLAELFGAVADTRAQRNPHQRLRGILSEKGKLSTYEELLLLILKTQGAPAGGDWDPKALELIVEAAGAVAGDMSSTNEVANFLQEAPIPTAGDGREARAGSRDNRYGYPPTEPKVEIKLGSIHSVKGETHTATLVLESYFHGHHLAQLKPWLLGSKEGGGGGRKQETARDLGRLRLHYVGMTRASHLLCLAMRKDSFAGDELALLQERGWQVVDCTV